MIDPGSGLLLLMLGSWAAVDGAAAGQVMVSRPLVSGTLAGWILGDPALGLLVGALLEGLHLGELPAGGARLPEPGPAAVPAVTLAVILEGGGPGIAAGVAMGGVWSLLGGVTVTLLRRFNGWLTRDVATGAAGASGLALRHWACIGMDGMRGGALTGFGLILALSVSGVLAGRTWWTLGADVTVLLLVLPVLPAAGVLLRGWASSWRHGALFLLGLAGGVILWISAGAGA
jgi:mannose/fructose/N-acetylgalactosamine-specific phosphotransferase system component IIC